MAGIDVVINGKFTLDDEALKSVKDSLQKLTDLLGEDFTDALIDGIDKATEHQEEQLRSKEGEDKSFSASDAKEKAKKDAEYSVFGDKKEEKKEDDEEQRGWAGNRFNKYADFIKYLKTPSDERDEEKGQKYVVKAMHQSADVLKTGIKTGFNIVEDIYQRMKSASPLLQSIETLFNLAMQLFFMPLGNKIAEVLIPATIQLVDNVVKMWDSFEGKTLPEMLDYAFSYGVKLFGQYFNNIGELLSNQGGLLGGIGNLIKTLGAFIEGPGVNLLTNILKAVNFVLSNLKYFIGAWVALKTAEFTMEAANALSIFSGKSATAAAGAILAASLGAGLATVGAANVMGMATGGYVAPKDGGSLRLLAEAGEGEYVVPESQVSNFVATHSSKSTDSVYTSRSTFNNTSSVVSGSKSESNHPVYITYNINGYTDSELKNIILDTVTEQVLKAAYKG